MQRSMVTLDLSGARRFVWIASLLILSLGAMHALLVGFAGMDPLDKGMKYLNLDAERTIISYYSASLMLVAALASLGVGLQGFHSGSRVAFYWLLLAVMMAYMSLDETVSLHENTSPSLRSAGVTPGFLDYSPWVLIGVPVVIAVGLFFIRFLLMIDRRIAARLFLAGVLFVGGSLVVEILASLLMSREASEGLYRLTTIFEEGGEILGITLFTTTVLSCLRISILAADGHEDALTLRGHPAE